MFSTVQMQLDINSSETASESDYNIILKKSDAEEFKNLFELYSNITSEHEKEGSLLYQANKETSNPDKDNSQYQFDNIYGYKNKESWRHIIINSSMITILMGFGLLIFTLSDIIEKFSIISLIILLASFVYGVIKNISNYYGYTVKSNEKYVYWYYKELYYYIFYIATISSNIYITCFTW